MQRLSDIKELANLISFVQEQMGRFTKRQKLGTGAPGGTRGDEGGQRGGQAGGKGTAGRGASGGVTTGRPRRGHLGRSDHGAVAAELPWVPGGGDLAASGVELRLDGW